MPELPKTVASPTDRQPTRKKKLPGHVDPDREFDKTSLRSNGSQASTVHRDYGAHFFRWGFVGNFSDAQTEILDVGCGPDIALAKILSNPRSNVPKRYVGVDMNKEPRNKPHRTWGTFLWEYNFLERYKELGKFDLVTNFEVIEHMKTSDGKKLLVGMRQCLKPDGQLLLSTPVYDGKAAAANHIHEWTIPELSEAIEEAGLEIVRRHGTFANKNAIKKVCTNAERALLEELGGYYAWEVLSCFLAPKYPDASRNNLWILKRKE